MKQYLSGISTFIYIQELPFLTLEPRLQSATKWTSKERTRGETRETEELMDRIFAATAAAILTPSTSGTSTPTSAPLNVAHTTTRSWTTTTFGQATPPPQPPRAGVSTAARISKEQARRGLYSRFMRGKVVEPEPEPEPELSEASTSISGAGVGVAGPSNSTPGEDSKKSKKSKGKGKEREGETKDEKRARKAEKAKRKQERELRRATRAELEIPSSVEVTEVGEDMGGKSKRKRKGEEVDGPIKEVEKVKKVKKIKKERPSLEGAHDDIENGAEKKVKKEKKSKKDKTPATAL